MILASSLLARPRKSVLRLTLDVREGIEYFKDSIRWVPTDHMLIDCLTKAMHPSLLNKYMTHYLYSFKCDDQLHATKRAAAKERKQQWEERLKQGGKKQVSRASCPSGAPSSPRSMCNVAIRDEGERVHSIKPFFV